MKQVAKYGLSSLVIISIVVCTLKFIIEVIHSYIEELKKSNELARNAIH